MAGQGYTRLPLSRVLEARAAAVGDVPVPAPFQPVWVGLRACLLIVVGIGAQPGAVAEVVLHDQIDLRVTVNVDPFVGIALLGNLVEVVEPAIPSASHAALGLQVARPTAADGAHALASRPS